MAAEHPIDASAYLRHRPEFSGRADSIMASFSGLSDGEIGKLTGLTPGLIASLRRMVSEFPDKSHGVEAIHAFTGVVFRQLHTETYGPDELTRLAAGVRIISSVYGWLRPVDIIKPYRLDFKSRTEPGGPNMMALWRSDVTAALFDDLHAQEDDDEVIDLLPADASRCIDWKAVAKVARVWRVDFKIVAENGSLRTPDAGKLKKLRGQLLDLALRRGAMTAQAMANLEGPDFAPADNPSTPGVIAFLSA